MAANNGDWPRNWDDLGDDYRTCVARSGQPWTFDEFSGQVEVDWDVDPQIDFKPVPDAPLPAATAAQRLIQLRALADNFSATELRKGKLEIMVRTPPIYRYEPASTNAFDGAVFAFNYVIDPEAFLIIEETPSLWTDPRKRSGATTFERLRERVINSCL